MYVLLHIPWFRFLNVKRNVSIHTLKFLGHTPLISYKGYGERNKAIRKKPFQRKTKKQERKTGK